MKKKRFNIGDVVTDGKRVGKVDYVHSLYVRVVFKKYKECFYHNQLDLHKNRKDMFGDY